MVYEFLSLRLFSPHKSISQDNSVLGQFGELSHEGHEVTPRKFEFGNLRGTSRPSWFAGLFNTERKLLHYQQLTSSMRQLAADFL
jgi:hypothetical protein